MRQPSLEAVEQLVRRLETLDDALLPVREISGIGVLSPTQLARAACDAVEHGHHGRLLSPSERAPDNPFTVARRWADGEITEQDFHAFSSEHGSAWGEDALHPLDFLDIIDEATTAGARRVQELAKQAVLSGYLIASGAYDPAMVAWRAVAASAGSGTTRADEAYRRYLSRPTNGATGDWYRETFEVAVRAEIAWQRLHIAFEVLGSP